MTEPTTAGPGSAEPAAAAEDAPIQPVRVEVPEEELVELRHRFLHLESPRDDASPLLITHGWPGSVLEQLKVIGPLTDPTAHGASATDAFHGVIPSMPGYGFSGKPTSTGWDPERTGGAWAALMQRLGDDRHAAQGGAFAKAVIEVDAS
jgi:pimeloyl-ACP methyl ester carboxylesterase